MRWLLLLGKKYTHILHLCSVLISVFFSVLSMVVLIGVLQISWREGACLELDSPDDLGWNLLSVFLEVCFPCYPLSVFLEVCFPGYPLSLNKFPLLDQLTSLFIVSPVSNQCTYIDSMFVFFATTKLIVDCIYVSGLLSVRSQQVEAA